LKILSLFQVFWALLWAMGISVFFPSILWCSHSHCQPSTRGKSQIWLQVREDSRHFLESCHVLVTSKYPVSKCGGFHVSLLRMWLLKGI
jgi:hypothetical protein